MTAKFTIRDDDLSYYSNSNKIETLYNNLIKSGFKISCGTIPCEAKTFHKNNRDIYRQTSKQKYIGDNHILSTYIGNLLNKGLVEIVLHGYDHRYKIKNKKFIGECIHKNYNELYEDLGKGKKYLESLFKTKIVSFIPPSNQIDRKTVHVLSKIGIKFLSGTINIGFNRSLTLRNFINYISYFTYHLTNGLQYPYILNNGLTKELTYYSINLSESKLQKSLLNCIKNNTPFVLLIHNWEIINNSKLSKKLDKFLVFANSHKVNPCLFKDLFKDG